MRVLMVNKFNYAKGGADRHFLDLVKLLKSQGHEVAIFAMENSKNNFSPWQKYFVSYVGYGEKDSLAQKLKGAARMFWSFEARRKMKKLLADFRPDLVHIHNIYHQLSPSILPVIKKQGIPVVMSVHDYKLICPNYLLDCRGTDASRLSFRGFVRNKCFKNSYLKSFLAAAEFAFHKKLDIYDKNIDLYISPSRFAKNKLVRSGIAAEKIAVLPHFADMPRENARKFANASLSAPYALYFGQLSREKGTDKLIKLFGQIGGGHLHLAGECAPKFKVKETDKIIYRGFLNSQELAEEIDNAAIVVSFSRLPETFGLIALETLTHSKPFVGFTGSAYAEIVQNEREGFLCRDENEIKESLEILFADQGLRILFSRNALEKAGRFSSQNYYPKIRQIYQTLLRGQKVDISLI